MSSVLTSLECDRPPQRPRPIPRELLGVISDEPASEAFATLVDCHERRQQIESRRQTLRAGFSDSDPEEAARTIRAETYQADQDAAAARRKLADHYSAIAAVYSQRANEAETDRMEAGQKLTESLRALGFETEERDRRPYDPPLEFGRLTGTIIGHQSIIDAAALRDRLRKEAESWHDSAAAERQTAQRILSAMQAARAAAADKALMEV